MKKKKTYTDYLNIRQDDLADNLTCFHTEKGQYEFMHSSIYHTKVMYLHHLCVFKDVNNDKIIISTYGEVLKMILKSKKYI